MYISAFTVLGNDRKSKTLWTHFYFDPIKYRGTQMPTNILCDLKVSHPVVLSQ